PLARPRDESDARNRFLAAAERLTRGGEALTGTRGGCVGLGGVAAGDVLVVQLDLGSGLCHSSPRVVVRGCRVLADYWATWVISKACGCCAAWGCSGPA